MSSQQGAIPVASVKIRKKSDAKGAKNDNMKKRLQRICSCVLLCAALLAAALLCAEGPGSIEDVIFERRFGCAAGFAALGGRVRVEGRTLYAEPGGTLQGTVLEAPDLRGGAALVIAALAAQGSSRITHTEFIDRGYADFAQKLTALGGQIARETPRGADCPKKRTSKT